MFKHLSKRTKVLLIIFGALVVVALGILTWGSATGAFSSSAIGISLPSGNAIGDAKDASTNAALSNVTFAIDGQTCTTGDDGRCTISDISAGEKTGTFTKTGYNKATVKRTCSFTQAPWARGTPS